MTRINKIIDTMQKNGLTQIIVSDPMSIFYITGRKIECGERLLALYINTTGDCKLIINKLFPQSPDSEIDLVWYNDDQDGVEILSRYINKNETIGIDKNWPSGFLIRLNEILKDIKTINSSFIVDDTRLIKDEHEQKLMRESSRLNDIAMGKIIPWINKRLTELELDKKMREIYKEIGCEDVSFVPIIAFGKNAANPHHLSDETIGKNGDCVIIDIGGMKDNYASDMTRTIFIGEPSDFFKEIYSIVKEANLRGISAAKPGAKMSDVDFAARSYIESKGYGKYFTHRTGHSIGLQDHEAGDVSASNSETIKVGQCFSVEPGIYIPEKNIGVRIEDLVLITENGCEVLNKFSKEIIVV